MLRVKGATICVMMFLGLFVFAATGQTGHDQFVCDLIVSKVGPKPANTLAKGNVIFFVDKDNKELLYKIQVKDIQDVYMTHLHMGPANKEGIIAAWLYPVGDHDSENRTIEGKFTGVLAEGTLKQEDIRHGITFEELIESLSNGHAYVNVHTKKFVMGAIRGQVYPQEFARSMDGTESDSGC